MSAAAVLDVGVVSAAVDFVAVGWRCVRLCVWFICMICCRISREIESDDNYSRNLSREPKPKEGFQLPGFQASSFISHQRGLNHRSEL